MRIFFNIFNNRTRRTPQGSSCSKSRLQLVYTVIIIFTVSIFMLGCNLLDPLLDLLLKDDSNKDANASNDNYFNITDEDIGGRYALFGVRARKDIYNVGFIVTDTPEDIVNNDTLQADPAYYTRDISSNEKTLIYFSILRHFTLPDYRLNTSLYREGINPNLLRIMKPNTKYYLHIFYTPRGGSAQVQKMEFTTAKLYPIPNPKPTPPPGPTGKIIVNMYAKVGEMMAFPSAWVGGGSEYYYEFTVNNKTIFSTTYQTPMIPGFIVYKFTTYPDEFMIFRQIQASDNEIDTNHIDTLNLSTYSMGYSIHNPNGIFLQADTRNVSSRSVFVDVTAKSNVKDVGFIITDTPTDLVNNAALQAEPAYYTRDIIANQKLSVFLSLVKGFTLPDYNPNPTKYNEGVNPTSLKILQPNTKYYINIFYTEDGTSMVKKVEFTTARLSALSSTGNSLAASDPTFIYDVSFKVGEVVGLPFVWQHDDAFFNFFLSNNKEIYPDTGSAVPGFILDKFKNTSGIDDYMLFRKIRADDKTMRSDHENTYHDGPSIEYDIYLVP